MEVQVGGLLFMSNFDSGNLAKVEKVAKVDINDTPVGKLFLISIKDLTFKNYYYWWGEEKQENIFCHLPS